MADAHAEITPDLAEWIAAQPVFFVATAPSGAGGHVNVSPKGLDTLRIVGPRRVAYLDLTGSGVETIAHLRENGRITIMFCAFEGNPRICRIYGRAAVHPLGSAAYDDMAVRFPALPGARSIIDVDVTRVATSCGYGVPLMERVRDRTRLLEWAQAKGERGLEDYRVHKNARSVDGLPGFTG